VAKTLKAGADDHPAAKNLVIPLATEMATYERRLPDLLTTAPGKFVVIRSTEILGVANDCKGALKVGHAKCGVDKPFFVEQIEAQEITARRTQLLLTKLECLR
jgi:hypothetical protein